MASEYCYGFEMQRALERHMRGEARVIPILLRPVLFKDAPFHPTATIWAGIGNVFAKLQQYQQAVEAYEEAPQLDDEVSLDYDELVRALMAIGRGKEAERYRERARELGYYDE